MDSEDAIRQDFLNGRIELIDAVSRLEMLGYAPRDAESLVNEWDIDGKDVP